MTDSTLTRTALYRLYDSDGQPLYIGITYDPLMRLEQHSRRTWWPLVEAAKVEWFSTRADAASAERDAIKAEDPKHNLVHANNPVWPPYAPPRSLIDLPEDEVEQHFAEAETQRLKARRLLQEAGAVTMPKSLAQILGELNEEERAEHLRLLRLTWCKENP